MIRRFTFWLAARQGYELHYPEAPEPETEPSETLANDGTPGAREPSRPTTYYDRHGHS